MAKWAEDEFILDDEVQQYRHVKTGKIYTLLHTGLEVTSDVAYEVVVYENEAGDVFVQSKERFFDGRFEEL